MLLALQLLLCTAGIWLVCRRSLEGAGWLVRRPYSIFAGVILIFQLPLSAGIGVAVGGAYGIRAIREGHEPITTAKAVQKYWWLDLVTTGGAVLAAAGIAAIGLRAKRLLPPLPDEPVGITDFRKLQTERWEYRSRDAATRR